MIFSRAFLHITEVQYVLISVAESCRSPKRSNRTVLLSAQSALSVVAEAIRVVVAHVI